MNHHSIFTDSATGDSFVLPLVVLVVCYFIVSAILEQFFRHAPC